MQSETDRRALQRIERAIAGIMTAIEEGLYQPFMKARMDELERQRTEIADRLAQAPPDVPDIHPNVSNIYRQNVVRFTEALDDPYGGREAAQALRSLIGQIVLTPGKNRGEVHAELRGELMGILEFAEPKQNQRAGRCMSAVAASLCNQLQSVGRYRTTARNSTGTRRAVSLLTQRCQQRLHSLHG